MNEEIKVERFVLDSVVVDRGSKNVNFFPSFGLNSTTFESDILDVFISKNEEGMYLQSKNRNEGNVYFYVIPITPKRNLIFPNLVITKSEGDALYYQYDNRSVYFEEDALKRYLVSISENRNSINDVFDESITEYSHEFRNLLKLVIDKIELMIDSYNIKGDRNLNIVLVNDISYLLSLIAMRLEYYNLAFSAEAQAVDTYLDIKREIDNVAKAVELRRRKKRIKILNEFSYGHKLHTSQLISIVFFIILENAIEYSDEDSIIKIYNNDKREYIEIVFENEGIVINDGQDVFFKGKASRSDLAVMRRPKGSGIGLSVAKQFCTRVLGGDIEFIQNRNIGKPPRTAQTRVYLLLPKNI